MFWINETLADLSTPEMSDKRYFERVPASEQYPDGALVSAAARRVL
jgi:hypothetical protein